MCKYVCIADYKNGSRGLMLLPIKCLCLCSRHNELGAGVISKLYTHRRYI